MHMQTHKYLQVGRKFWKFEKQETVTTMVAHGKETHECELEEILLFDFVPSCSI